MGITKCPIIVFPKIDKINFLGEMIDGKPMFPGKHYLDQISKIQVKIYQTFNKTKRPLTGWIKSVSWE